jgi:hypothetical protein
MNVYIVSTGEHGEGDTAEAAFATLAGARQYVLNTYDICVFERTRGVWLGHRGPVDEVYIRRLAVREAS